MWLPHSFIAVLFAVLAKGALTNNTFDDTSFTFGGTWAALSATSPCTSTSEAPCTAQPGPSQTYGETWLVGTIHPGAPPSATWGSFTFKGSAVYIFGIGLAGQAEIDFTLDKNTNPTIYHYTGTQQFAYNALFFSATGLPSDQMHTVFWELKATGNAAQSALFDYAIVTSGQEGMPTTGATGAAANPGPTTTQIITPSDSELPTEPVTTTVSGTGSNTMGSSTGQGQAAANESQPTGSGSRPTGNESQPTGEESQSGSGAGQLGPAPHSALATSPLPPHQPTSSGTDTDTGSGGSPPGTPQSASSASKSKTNVGAIAGGVIGAVFAVLVIVFVWLRFRKMRRRAASRALDSRFLRIEDYYARQDAPPPSSTHQVNPLPVSVDRSTFEGEHLYNNSETGLTGPSAASLLPQTDSHVGMTHSDLIPFPHSEPAATDTSHNQERPSADEGMIGDARSTSTESRSSISSFEDND